MREERPGPPPGDEALTDFLGAIEDSRILHPEQLGELRALLRGGCRGPRDLAEALVQRGWLTAWQVNRVYRGRGSSLRVGPYLLEERLGCGAMGDVFKASHTAMRRPVALKLLRADRVAQGGGAERFFREARAVARLDHPNVVHAYDAGCAGGRYYLAMEYVGGADLKRVVEAEGPLEPARACDLVRQSALGLQHAFEQGVVHRDVKPANLLLSARGVVKVLDLGLARLKYPEGEGAGQTLTATGHALGTADYVAPEQLRDSRSVDTRADLYGLGCTLYFLLGGRVPFPGGSLLSKLLRHLREEPQPLESVRPDVPAALAGVVRELMAKDPAHRFQTPAELAAALAAA
jgi:serine/threonine protein kinase